MATRFIALCGRLLAVFALASLVVAAPPVEARRLPPVDLAADAARSAAGDAGTEAALAPPGVSHDARVGAPAFLWGEVARAGLVAGEGRPSPKRALEPAAAARAHLAELRDAYGLTADEVTALPLRQLQQLPDGAAIVRFGQAVDGVEVFREYANVLLDRERELVAVGGALAGARSVAPKRAHAQLRGPEHAVAVALAEQGFPAAIAASLQPAGAGDGYVRLALPRGMRGDDGSELVDPVRAKAVWFRDRAGLVPAYYLETQVRDGASPQATDSHAYVIAAADGRVLYRRNQTAHAAFSYRVYAEAGGANLPLPWPAGRNAFPHPTGAPDGYQAPLVARQPRHARRTCRSAATTRGCRPARPGPSATTSTRSRTALRPTASDLPTPTSATSGAPVAGDLHACTSSPGAFDYPHDPAQGPAASRAQVMAAVTNLFYMINYLHDWYYDAGFDEASGNAQDDNFGRGGLAGDAILAEAQDYANTNNADMTTPADGARPRMRMYLWNSSAALAKVNAPAAVAGIKEAGTAAFGPTSFDLTGDLVVARDAVTTDGPSTTDGCSPLTNAAAVAGRIAVDRPRRLPVRRQGPKNAQDARRGRRPDRQQRGRRHLDGRRRRDAHDPGRVGDARRRQRDQGRARPWRKGEHADGAQGRRAARRRGRQLADRRTSGATTSATGWSATPTASRPTRPRGMGEGFADFHALLLLVKDADRAAADQRRLRGTYASTAYRGERPRFRPRRRQQRLLLRRAPLSVLARHDEESADVPAHRRRRRAAGGARRLVDRPRRARNAEVHNARAKSGRRCCGSATPTCSTTRRGSRSRRRRTG